MAILAMKVVMGWAGVYPGVRKPCLRPFRRSHASAQRRLHARNSGLVVPSLRAAVVRGGRGKHGFPLGRAGAWLPHSREKRCAMISSQRELHAQNKMDRAEEAFALECVWPMPPQSVYEKWFPSRPQPRPHVAIGDGNPAEIALPWDPGWPRPLFSRPKPLLARAAAALLLLRAGHARSQGTPVGSKPGPSYTLLAAVLGSTLRRASRIPRRTSSFSSCSLATSRGTSLVACGPSWHSAPAAKPRTSEFSCASSSVSAETAAGPASASC